MSVRRTVGVLAIGLVSMSCGSRQLSRSAAADLIKSGKILPAVYEVSIPLGSRCEQINIMEPRNAQVVLALRLQQAGNELKNRGLISATARHVNWDYFAATSSPRPTGPCSNVPPILGGYWDWQVGITDRGRQLGLDGSKVRLATSEFVAVTGLAQIPNGQTMAEYSYRWVPTALGKEVPSLLPSSEPQNAKAMFQLFDDGWRLVR